jgi:glycosyltransferase involved in cell wall biosynthesis
MSNVDVSFLMCTNTFDEAFKESVNSCLNQSVRDIEIVIVVNGVDKNVRQQISNFCQEDKIKLVFSEAKYLSYNLNLGLNHCQSNYIARIDSDDTSHPQRIEKQLSFLKENSDVAVCGSAYQIKNDNGVVTKKVILPCFDSEIRRKLYFTNPLAHPSVMFRKDVILSIGGYMGGRYGQDYDLWLRLAKESSFRFHNLTDVLINYNHLGGGARKSKYSFASASAAQWRLFVLTFNPVWLVSSILSLAKRVFYSKK